MDLPENWPIPEHLPEPLTMNAHAEKGDRVLASDFFGERW